MSYFCFAEVWHRLYMRGVMRTMTVCGKMQPIILHEWSMFNACTPQGQSILGTGGEKKKGVCTQFFYTFSHSDGGISRPRAMTPPTFVSTRFFMW